MKQSTDDYPAEQLEMSGRLLASTGGAPCRRMLIKGLVVMEACQDSDQDFFSCVKSFLNREIEGGREGGREKMYI